MPYLASVPDPYDSISPHHRWGPFRLRSAQLAQRLHVPGVRSLSLALDGSGRVASVLVRWRGGSARVPGGRFETDLGLLSTCFRVGGARVARGAAPSTPRQGQPSWSGDWPAGQTGYTVVLGSTPLSSGLASARAEAARASRAGLPHVGVLVSSRFATLHPAGYYVIFSGVYGIATRAEIAAHAAATRYPSAYPRRIA